MYKFILLVFFAIAVVSCGKSTDNIKTTTGSLSLSISQINIGNDVVNLNTKSAPALTEFNIKVTDTQGGVFYDGLFSDDMQIVLPAGECTVTADYGDNKPGFENPYYKGSRNIVILPGDNVSCEITASLANSIVEPKYSESLLSQFISYSTRVVSAETTIEIQPSEPRDLYVPSAVPCRIDMVGVNGMGENVVKQITDGSFIPEKGTRYVGNYNVIRPSFSMPEQNLGTVWSTSFELTELSVSNFVNSNHYAAYINKVHYEYSLDGNNWIEVLKADDNFYRVSYLNSNTLYRYYLRAYIDFTDTEKIYNTNNVTFAFTTESQNQLINSGMEDWRIDKFKTYNYYKPWAGDDPQFWNTSNPRCFTYNGVNTQYNSPTSVVYTKSAKSGSRAAELRSVKIDVAGRENVVAKLLIGSLTSKDANGLVSGAQNPEYLTEGRDFNSRPTKLRFWYKYNQYGTDSYVITIRVRNNDTVIADKQIEGSGTNTSYQMIDIDIPYSVSNLKATSLYICFASSKDSGFDFRKMSVEYPDGSSSGWKAYVGSVLNIDDIELIYEK